MRDTCRAPVRSLDLPRFESIGVRVEPADLLAVRLAEVLAERDRRAALALLRRAQQLAKVEVRAGRALLGRAGESE